MWKKRINRTDLRKVIALCEEHFEESCFDKSIDVRRKLMNSKDEFKFDFVFLTLLLCLLGEVLAIIFIILQQMARRS